MVGIAEIITSKGMLGNAVHITVCGRITTRIGIIEYTLRKIIELVSPIRKVIEIVSASLHRI